jgi:hypothetical protein
MKIVILFMSGLLLATKVLAFGPVECRDQLFFNENELSALRSQQDSWVVVRALGDCETVRQVTLMESATGEIQAEVLRPVGGSISEQLKRLEGRFPETQPEELCHSVKIKKMIAGPEKNRDLAALMSDLKHQRVAPVFDPVIYVHGVGYKIWIGSSINLSFFDFEGPPFRHQDRLGDLHPLDTWSQKLLSLVGANCALK